MPNGTSPIGVGGPGTGTGTPTAPGVPYPGYGSTATGTGTTTPRSVLTYADFATRGKRVEVAAPAQPALGSCGCNGTGTTGSASKQSCICDDTVPSDQQRFQVAWSYPPPLVASSESGSFGDVRPEVSDDPAAKPTIPYVRVCPKCPDFPTVEDIRAAWQQLQQLMPYDPEFYQECLNNLGECCRKCRSLDPDLAEALLSRMRRAREFEQDAALKALWDKCIVQLEPCARRTGVFTEGILGLFPREVDSRRRNCTCWATAEVIMLPVVMTRLRPTDPFTEDAELTERVMAFMQLTGKRGSQSDPFYIEDDIGLSTPSRTYSDWCEDGLAINVDQLMKLKSAPVGFDSDPMPRALQTLLRLAEREFVKTHRYRSHEQIKVCWRRLVVVNYSITCPDNGGEVIDQGLYVFTRDFCIDDQGNLTVGPITQQHVGFPEARAVYYALLIAANRLGGETQMSALLVKLIGAAMEQLPGYDLGVIAGAIADYEQGKIGEDKFFNVLWDIGLGRVIGFLALLIGGPLIGGLLALIFWRYRKQILRFVMDMLKGMLPGRKAKPDVDVPPGRTPDTPEPPGPNTNPRSPDPPQIDPFTGQPWYHNYPNGRTRAPDGAAGRSAPTDFVGKLRGELVEFGIPMDSRRFTKVTKEARDKARREFNSSGRKEFLTDLADNDDAVRKLKAAGLTDDDIVRMKNGNNPDGYQVHHKIPLDAGGTNAASNLILVKNEPYHKAITNYQNEMMRRMNPGKTVAVEWPRLDGIIYPS
ncbi:MAG: HNH endonuclease signature motif containing protein [Planctomycetota bacterium]